MREIQFCFRKSLVVFVIFLFIGVSVAPVITADESIESDDSERIELKIQIFKNLGVENNKVLLSKEKYNELLNLIDNFNFQIENSKSIEKTSEIFYDIAKCLEDYGVLPDDISVEELYKIITGDFNNLVKNNICETSSNNILVDDNYFCFISGNMHGFVWFANFFTYLVHFFGKIDIDILPIKLLNDIIFGSRYYWHGWHYNDAYGKVFTIGLAGVKIFEGVIWGNLDIFKFDELPSGPWEYFVGVRGFTGIRLRNTSGNVIFFGYARHVRLTGNTLCKETRVTSPTPSVNIQNTNQVSNSQINQMINSNTLIGR